MEDSLNTPGEYPIFRKIERIPTQSYHADIPNRVIEAIAEKVNADPSIHTDIASNPYSHRSQLRLHESFSAAPTSDAIRGVLLAEPQGEFEDYYNRLTLEEKKDNLYHQMDVSADMMVRLKEYYNNHEQEFWELPPDQIYERLTEVTFRSNDIKEIERSYSQNQRRDFRLSIVRFIDDIPKLKRYKKLVDDDPRATINTLFQQEFEGTFEVEVLPTGIVVYFDENDFSKLRNGLKGESLPFASTLQRPNFPAELDGRVIIINKSKLDPGKTIDETVEIARTHELKHAVFHTFHRQAPSMAVYDIDEFITNNPSFEDYKQYIEIMKSTYLNQMKNEIVAYGLDTGHLNIGKMNGMDFFNRIGYTIGRIRETNMEPKLREELSEVFQREVKAYVQNVQEYQYIVQKIYKYVKSHEGQLGGLSPDKLEALILQTPVDKIGRLLAFIGESPQEIDKKIKKRKLKSLKKFNLKVDDILSDATNVDLRLEKEIGLPVFDEVTTYASPESISSYLNLIAVTNSSLIMKRSLIAIRATLFADDILPEDLRKIKSNLEKVLEHSKGHDFEDAYNVGQDILKDIHFIHIPRCFEQAMRRLEARM